MPHKRLPHREATAFIEQLRESGAREIRRLPTDVTGNVEVRWRESEMLEERYRSDMAAWKGPMVLAVLVAMLIAGLVVAITLG